MKKASSIWNVPAHITGLFQVIQHTDPLLMGSRGAGFSINRGFITRVVYEENNQDKIKILFNNIEIDGRVTLDVIKTFQEYLDNLSITIYHTSDFPMQAGFGASGAGAIGTAFALNELFDTNKTNQELGQIAHKAEVLNRTGLGDVIAQMQGNAEMRLVAGAPGFGKIMSIDWPKDQMILTSTLGKLSTKEIITDPKMIKKINHYSSKLLAKLQQRPALNEFIAASYKFAEKTGLMTMRVRELIKDLRKKGYSASMIMLGESFFVIGKYEELIKCNNFIDACYPNAQIWIDTLATTGPLKFQIQ